MEMANPEESIRDAQKRMGLAHPTSIALALERREYMRKNHPELMEDPEQQERIDEMIRSWWTNKYGDDTGPVE